MGQTLHHYRTNLGEQVNASLNMGVVFRGPNRHRPNDTLALGAGYAHVSSQAAGRDSDNNAINGVRIPVRSSEKFIELSYQYQATPWLQIQPDVQYVFNPGASIVNPNAAGERVKNIFMLGTRINISF